MSYRNKILKICYLANVVRGLRVCNDDVFGVRRVGGWDGRVEGCLHVCISFHFMFHCL